MSSFSTPFTTSPQKVKKEENRFSGIRSTIDTGLHAGNVKVIPLRQGESFRRLKGSELSKLIEIELEPQESIFRLLQNQDKLPMNQSLQISQVSDDLDSKENESQCPYLLLDIRDIQQYNKYHIKTSMLYDPLSIRRDRLGNDVYKYKNKENKIIIICCDDEIQGIDIATQMTQKFINNIFLLSTSVNRFCGKYNNLSNGNKLPNPPSQHSPKVIHYAPHRMNKTKSRKKFNKPTFKLNQANLNSNNRNNGDNGGNTPSMSRMGSDAQSVASKLTKASYISTRTWLP